MVYTLNSIYSCIIGYFTMIGKIKKNFINLFMVFLMLSASLAFGLKFAIKRIFGATATGEIATALLLPVIGSEKRLIRRLVATILLYTLIPLGLMILFLFGNKINYVTKQKIIAAISSLLFSVSLFPAVSEIAKTIGNYNHPNELLRNYFVSPKKISVTFPHKKRNLIYIMVESLESSFFSKVHGGAIDDNVIPELYKLAQDNICFSVDNNCLGMKPSRDCWTMAATVAQSSGIPFIVPWGENEYPSELKFLPGVTSLFDILHNNSYKQAYICGSKVHFSGMDNFLKTHKVDFVYDLITAKQEKFVPEDYDDGWWGMEDKKTFDYAKKKIMEISNSDSPFACVIATIDTHFWGGNFRDDCCRHQFDEQWLNVYACTSRLVNAFVEWLKKQSFYSDTTIVIVGDHPTRLHGYTPIADDYHQHVYNCFINSPVAPLKEKNRDFTLYDMFPTILASLGCEIQGDRLGLGTNLFSDKNTLYEELGEEAFWEKIGTEKSDKVDFWYYFSPGNCRDYNELFLLNSSEQYKNRKS